MGRGTWIVVLASAALGLGLTPGVAAAGTCPQSNLAAITVYAPELVRPGADFTVELEGEAVTADGYANVVVSIGGVRTPVALEGFGEASATVRAPARPGRYSLTVTWDQAAGADGVETSAVPVGACTGSVTADVLVADWSGTPGNLSLPRVQGRWIVTMSAPGQARSRIAWRAAPDCGIGACELALGIGQPWAQVLMRLGGGVYRGGGDTRMQGVVCPVNGVERRGPADANVRISLSVAGQRTVRGQLVATRLAGWAVTWMDDPGGPIAVCGSTSRVRVRLAAVRG